jgi:hypothetical protein
MEKHTILRVVGEDSGYDETDDIKKLLFLMKDEEIKKGIFRQLEVLIDVRRKEVDALYRASTIEPESTNIIDIRRHQIIQASHDQRSLLFLKFQKAIATVEWYRTMLLLDFKTKIEPALNSMNFILDDETLVEFKQNNS